MKRDVIVAGGDILTALGNLDDTWQGLLAQRSGLEHQELGWGVPAYPLGRIRGMQEQGGTALHLEEVLDHLCDSMPPLPENCDLVVATTKGAVDELIESPATQRGQPWTLGEYLAHRLGVRGEVRTVSGACASGTIALINGAAAIDAGLTDHVLVVGIDLIGRFILTGFDSLKALSPSAPRPFDRQRDGLALADGASWALLSGGVQAMESGLARLSAGSIRCDASHITAPCRQASGLKRVLAQLQDNGIPVIGGINGHGTATVYNDAMELRAFGEHCPPGTPLCSTKGALGHSLAATGLIEAMLSVRSLNEMKLPPTVGLQEPEETSLRLSGDHPLPLIAPSVLSSNSGFGGINAAVLFTPIS